MASYVLDMGFDIEESREYQGRYYPLQAGLAKVNPTLVSGEGDPWWLTRLKSRDQFHFRVWDISAKPNGSTLLSFWASFFAARSAVRLADQVSDQSNPQICSDCDLQSVDTETAKTSVYTPVQAGWILSGGTSTLGRTLKLVDVPAPTRYVLQVRVEIKTSTEDLRTYVYDPEVIIGPFG